MIKFIYQVCEEAVIGFALFDTEQNETVMFNGDDIWESTEAMIKSIETEEDLYDISLGKEFYLDLIPKDWNKVKFKQI